ncbi:polyisoprenoid-binding protein [Streptomyces armeniacus]|uniref:Polyisoprenoid-binding protein n=1 Tax=Streptomyces armeniacus TaxID=83291 RepID=A0A345XM37_9ACTN|nr:YceI family protein [Streptomyces armeniacus]AXK32703.1 polyisoprenoid-binding protein [Streptomyces armeniacus]
MGLFTRRRRRNASLVPSSSLPEPPTVQAAGPRRQENLALSKLTGDWVFDPAHSSVGFAARHAMITRVRGIFTSFEGRIRLDGEHPEASTAEVVVDVSSVDTRVEQRDEHLRSADFFDAGLFPVMTFRSTQAVQVEEDVYRMTGALTIRDRTNPVTIDLLYSGSVIDAFGVERAGFDGSAIVNRSDWGLIWNARLETGGVLVGEKIKLEFDISAIRVS